MTSREVSPRKLEGSLDVMIRRALHDGAASSGPGPGVWERITEGVGEGAGSGERAVWWQRLRLAVGSLARELVELPLNVPPEFTTCYPPLPRYLWETDGSWLLLPRGELPMGPGSAGSGVVPLLN